MTLANAFLLQEWEFIYVRCFDVWMCRCADMQMRGYANVRMDLYTDR
jgi:hypothetical protein